MSYFHENDKKQNKLTSVTNSSNFQKEGVSSSIPPPFKATTAVPQMKEDGKEKEETLQKKENRNSYTDGNAPIPPNENTKYNTYHSEPKQFKPYQLVAQKKAIKQFKQHSPFQLKDITAPQKNQGGLPQEVQAKMENAMGHDFSNVNIHRNSKNVTDTGALAYAQGNDVHFAPGQFKPDTTSGQELIGHELAHVVQQREGRVKPTKMLGKGIAVNDDPSLEKEADDMGRKAAQMKFNKTISSRNNIVQSSRFIQKKLPKETPTNYKTFNALMAMTLFSLDSYAKKQADWHASPHLTVPNRDIIRLVLGFGREGGVLSALGGMKVSDIHTEMVARGAIHVEKYLKIYAKAVSEQDPFQLNPMTTAGAAIDTAKNLETLKIALPTYMLKSGMKENIFRVLEGNNFIPSLVHYYSTASPHPSFEATNGADFGSYNNMKATDGVDPISFSKAPLTSNIRNFHRFEKVALDQLIVNFNDTTKTKPLTLILHTALDHNGAFHRDSKLTEVIKNPNMNTILIEGKETLADIQGEITPISKKYGKNDKIDQVMIAGHGNARSMQLGGKVQDDGKGEIQEISNGIDLDHNKIDSDKLMMEILDNMDVKGVKKSDLQPHRRIIFNACLTNSNAVRTTIKAGNIADAKIEIKQYIKNNASLATYMQNLAKNNKNKVTSIGSNASFGQIDLIDASDNLDLVDVNDPKITAPKIEYVEFGVEPTGAMRAVVESWANNESACKTAMKNRIKLPATDWDNILIKKLYQICINKYMARPSVLILMEQVAAIVGHLKSKVECKPSNFRGVDTLGADFADLTTALSVSTEWTNRNYIPLVMYQGWMTADPGNAAIKASFLVHLGANFTCQSARKFIDIDYLDKNGHFPDLLSATGKGQTILALLGILNAKKQTDCKTYLISELNASDQFDPTKGINAKLDGLGTEDQVLVALGKLVAPSKKGSAVAVSIGIKDANVLINGDTKNKEYVNSVSYEGTIKTTPHAEIFSKPDAVSPKLAPLVVGSDIFVLGEIDTWWAIEFKHGTNSGTAFVRKNDVNIL